MSTQFGDVLPDFSGMTLEEVFERYNFLGYDNGCLLYTSRCVSETGVAHNGIIRLTSDPNNKRYSDTAIFVADYLSQILHARADLRDRRKLSVVYQLAQSKFAIMDGGGYVATVGAFIHERGLLFSNGSYRQWGA